MFEHLCRFGQVSGIGQLRSPPHGADLARPGSHRLRRRSPARLSAHAIDGVRELRDYQAGPISGPAADEHPGRLRFQPFEPGPRGLHHPSGARRLGRAKPGHAVLHLGRRYDCPNYTRRRDEGGRSRGQGSAHQTIPTTRPTIWPSPPSMPTPTSSSAGSLADDPESVARTRDCCEARRPGPAARPGPGRSGRGSSVEYPRKVADDRPDRQHVQIAAALSATLNLLCMRRFTRPKSVMKSRADGLVDEAARDLWKGATSGDGRPNGALPGRARHRLPPALRRRPLEAPTNRIATLTPIAW